MKIIVEGQIPPEPVYFGTCKHCHCQFECMENELGWDEVTAKKWDQIKKSHIRGMSAICPTCGRPVYMRKKGQS